MKMLTAATSAALLMLSTSAQANWAVNIGPVYVAPDSSSSSLNVIEQVAELEPGSTALRVNDDVQLGITIDYKFNPNWAVQLIAATPFSHDIRVQGSAIDGLAVGNTKHLPPTLLGQYHFTQFGDRWQPFIGVGVNYTTFFDESIDPQLSGALNSLGVTTDADAVSLTLSDSWGLALQAGVNVQLTPQLGIHAMVSRMDISTTGRVRVNGETVQSVSVDIDPVVTMVGLRWQF
ncbi:MAG: OmpW family protein [Idiomarina sp.]|nr:OmpW family protein [Idiomarina sp.]